MKYVLAGLLLGLAAMAGAEAGIADSFQTAKKHGARIYADRRIDQYCGCRYDKSLRIDSSGCGYRPRKNPKRGQRIEWEHVVPAENIGRFFSCWRAAKSLGKNSRQYCLDTDPAYRAAHNDLHNLIPVLGELNGDRANFRFTELDGRADAYGRCDFQVDFKQRAAEPPQALKGDIARITLYMEQRYGIRLAKNQRRLLRLWAQQDPVDSWERLRNTRISAVQGTGNPFVAEELASHQQEGRSRALR